jgi:hypothetical protein
MKRWSCVYYSRPGVSRIGICAMMCLILALGVFAVTFGCNVWGAAYPLWVRSLCAGVATAGYVALWVVLSKQMYKH